MFGSDSLWVLIVVVVGVNALTLTVMPKCSVEELEMEVCENVACCSCTRSIANSQDSGKQSKPHCPN